MEIDIEKLANAKEATLRIRHQFSREGGEIDCITKLCYDGGIIGRMSTHVSNGDASDMERMREMHVNYFIGTLERQKYEVKVNGDKISISR